MKTVIVRYRLKPEAVEENDRLVAAVFAALAERRPAGLRYESFKLPDHARVHLAQIDTKDGASPLQALEAFRAFTAGIKDRCLEPPVASDVEPIGSYTLLAE